jgi:hypothetical protein
MTKAEAHELLTARRGGLAVLPSTIDYALFLTGDLGGNALGFSEGMDKSLQQENKRSWQSQGYDMVAQSGRYYGSQAWFDVHYGIKETNEPTKEQT